jgi:hypothetical protein
MDQENFTKVPIYYEFRAEFVVFDNKNEVKFIKPPIERFIDDQPIIARENALMRYQSFIDVILQSIGKTYVSDRKTRRDLIDYYNAIYKRSMTFEGNGIPLNKSLSYTIGVYLINNTTEFRNENDFRKECEKEYDGLSDKEKASFFETFEAFYSFRKLIWDQNKSYLIHGIEYFNGMNELDPWIHGSNLWTEFMLYRELGLDFKDYKTIIQVYAADIGETDEFEILETPFEWDGYDQPYQDNAETSSENEEEIIHPTTLQEMISLGESRTMEFKPSIFFDHTKKRRGSGLPCAIAISAFLNSEGGILCIGINDDKTLQGIDADFSLFSPIKPEDSMKLMFDGMISNFFDPFVHCYLDTRFATLEGKRIFFIIVKPSSEPVFIKIQQDGVIESNFYIRRQASNKKLVNLEEFYYYVKTRWFS